MGILNLRHVRLNTETLCNPSSVGPPRNDSGNERTVGLPRARVHPFARSLAKANGGGTTLFYAQQGTLCTNMLVAITMASPNATIGIGNWDGATKFQLSLEPN